MPCIVKVIAHTKFLGVPDDLLPLEKATKGLIGSERTDADLVRSRARSLLADKGQDQGADADRLIECAGRNCYDSYGVGRPSSEYHKHIEEVDHGSVQEHATLTFFISAVSRGLTHELVRHRVGVAISQRSTRYVDENESPYVHHPLVEAYIAEANGVPRDEIEHRLNILTSVMGDRAAYVSIRDTLEPWLIAKGVDKFTARKQARGAARGYLGNALQTEMVWTVNVRAFKGILKQRANAAADAEIRLLAMQLYECALPYWPAYLGHLKQRPCPDGLGYELYDPNGLKEKHRVLVEAVKKLGSLNPEEGGYDTRYREQAANLLKLAS